MEKFTISHPYSFLQIEVVATLHANDNNIFKILVEDYDDKNTYFDDDEDSFDELEVDATAATFLNINEVENLINYLQQCLQNVKSTIPIPIYSAKN